ncbi:hypothetical protein B0J11DRAFT_500231 [Dendryphion nanum]|uniref:Uncharacterized protein n=1 Tax=Dendryphion nanum TaxID=256645 RepID=A0A9P9EJ11_9PLEO|nr:hypothetical protein B0J11DRAFT_500231 [Dendryphion nanum]
MKRRMTAQAHHPSVAPSFPLFSLGGLFSARREPQTAWRYEPPTFPQPFIPPDLPPEPPVPMSTIDQGPSLRPPAESTSPEPLRSGPSREDVEQTEASYENNKDRTENAILHGTTLGDPDLHPSKMADITISPPTYEFKQTEATIRRIYTTELERFLRYSDTIRTAKDFQLGLNTYIFDNFPKDPAHVPRFALTVILGCTRAGRPIWEILPSFAGWSRSPSLTDSRSIILLHHLERLDKKLLDRDGRRFIITLAMRALRDSPGIIEAVRCSLHRLIWELALESAQPDERPRLYSILKKMATTFQDPLLVEALLELHYLRGNQIDCINQVIKPYRRSTQGMSIVARILDCLPRPILSNWIRIDPGLKLKSAYKSIHRTHSYEDFDHFLRLLAAKDSLVAFPKPKRNLPSLVEEAASEYSIRPTTMKIISESLAYRRQFQHILARAKDAHLLPLNMQRQSFEELITSAVPILHQLAHQYSIDLTRTPKQNWRSMYYMYKYLKMNGHPIGPLFTRAVTRSLITHPLSQNNWVSSRRLVWVCDMVAKAEGEPVASKIQSVFWHWRGELISYAARRLHDVGGHGRASVTTMKKLGLL